MPYMAIKSGENKGVYYFSTKAGEKLATLKCTNYSHRKFQDNEKDKALLWAGVPVITKFDNETNIKVSSFTEVDNKKIQQTEKLANTKQDEIDLYKNKKENENDYDMSDYIGKDIFADKEENNIQSEKKSNYKKEREPIVSKSVIDKVDAIRPQNKRSGKSKSEVNNSTSVVSKDKSHTKNAKNDVSSFINNNVLDFLHLLKKYSDMGYSLVIVTMNNGEEFDIILHNITYFSLLPRIKGKLINSIDGYLALIVDDANNYSLITKDYKSKDDKDKIVNYLNGIKWELAKTGKEIQFTKILDKTKFIRYGEFLFCNKIGKVSCDMASINFTLNNKFDLFNGVAENITYFLTNSNYAIRPDCIASIKPKTLNYEIINHKFLDIFNAIDRHI